jgi:hypothetical protein
VKKQRYIRRCFSEIHHNLFSVLLEYLELPKPTHYSETLSKRTDATTIQARILTVCSVTYPRTRKLTEKLILKRFFGVEGDITLSSPVKVSARCCFDSENGGDTFFQNVGLAFAGLHDVISQKV